MAVEATRVVGDADRGAEDESCALVGHDAGELEMCHRVCQWIFNEHPNLAHQLSVFFWHRQVILVDALLVLDGNAGRHEDLYWFEPPERYNTLHPIRAARVSCTGL